MTLTARSHPLANVRRQPLDGVMVDARAVTAFDGDTLLTLLNREIGAVRRVEFGEPGTMRAGFCAIGACQDCWVSLSDGSRLRACTSFVVAGMHIVTDLGDGG